MKKLLVWIMITLSVFMPATALDAVAESTPANAGDAGCAAYISDYMALYGYALPQDITQSMCDSFIPVTIACDNVQVTFSEVLYDGRSLYTAASVTPSNPKETLIMPGGAFGNDPVSGHYGETAYADTRTFLSAAEEDGKNLICVYVYPEIFDQVGAYFLDYLQKSNTVSVLLSGASMALQDTLTDITWTVQIYGVDLDTQAFSLLNRCGYSTPVTPLPTINRRTYTPEEAQDTPCSGITLTQTALAVYADPQWKDGNTTDYTIKLLDMAGNTIAAGISILEPTFSLDQLPDQFYVQWKDNTSSDWSSPLLLTVSSDI